MATATTNYGLKKPAANDYYNVEDQNGNMEILDAELAKRLSKTDAADGLKVTFTAADSRTLPSTGETLAVLWGKVLKWLSDLGTAALCSAEAFASASHTHKKTDITDFPSSMTPTAHKDTHKTGGSDAITPADIGAADEILTGNSDPNGTTSAKLGQLYFNTASGALWYCSGIDQTNYSWKKIAGMTRVLMTEIITETKNWTVPAGIVDNAITVRLFGGGGGGNWGGGGGGHMNTKTVTASSGSAIKVTIGVGGAGGTYSNSTAGNGGTTSFGSLLSANGGSGAYTNGGGGGSGGGGAGGSASGGTPSSGSSGGTGAYGGGGGTGGRSGEPYSSDATGTAGYTGLNGAQGGAGGDGGRYTAGSGYVCLGGGGGGGGGGYGVNGSGGGGGTGGIGGYNQSSNSTGSGGGGGGGGYGPEGRGGDGGGLYGFNGTNGGIAAGGGGRFDRGNGGSGGSGICLLSYYIWSMN